MLLTFWKRPSVWVGVVAIVAYSDPQALRDEFVYDDTGSVKRNVVVTGMVPLSDLFKRDYWGTPLVTVSTVLLVPSTVLAAI
jgi:hypothetical protein